MEGWTILDAQGGGKGGKKWEIAEVSASWNPGFSYKHSQFQSKSGRVKQQVLVWSEEKGNRYQIVQAL